jgi:hypothetical protein
MIHLRRLILVFLGIGFGLCLDFFLLNPALATGPMSPNTSDKITDQKTQQPDITALALQEQGDYGRLPERFIVNRGQPDERIQIYMEGERPTVSSNNAKRVLHDNNPQKQTLRLRPFVKGENVKSDTVNEAAAEATSDDADVVGGFVATVTGPGELSFIWKVSCEPFAAYLEATLDGKQISKISGEIDWSLKKLTIPAGSHTLSRLYCKRDDSKFGADCGWLHQVEFTTSETPENL